jgi:hypothetical protein
MYSTKTQVTESHSIQLRHHPIKQLKRFNITKTDLLFIGFCVVGVKVAKLQRSATQRLKASSSKNFRKNFYFSIQPEVLEATWC